MEYTQKVDAVRIKAVEFADVKDEGAWNLFSEVPEWLKAEGEAGSINVRDDHTNDYSMIVFTSGDKQYLGQADDWIVRYPDGYVRVWSDADFQKNFVLFDPWT